MPVIVVLIFDQVSLGILAGGEDFHAEKFVSELAQEAFDAFLRNSGPLSERIFLGLPWTRKNQTSTFTRGWWRAAL